MCLLPVSNKTWNAPLLQPATWFIGVLPPNQSTSLSTTARLTLQLPRHPLFLLRIQERPRTGLLTTSTSDCRSLRTTFYTLLLALMLRHSRRPNLAANAGAPCALQSPAIPPPFTRQPRPRRTSPTCGMHLRRPPSFLLPKTYHRPPPSTRPFLRFRLLPPLLRMTVSRPSQRRYNTCDANSWLPARRLCAANSPLLARTSAPSGPRRMADPRPCYLPSLLARSPLRRPPWRPPRPPHRCPSCRRASPLPLAPRRPPRLQGSCRTSSAGMRPPAASPPLGLWRRPATTNHLTSSSGVAPPGPLARSARARPTAIPPAPRGSLRPLPQPLPRLRARTPLDTSATRTTAAPFGRPSAFAPAHPHVAAAPPALRGLLSLGAVNTPPAPLPSPRPPPPLPALLGCGGRRLLPLAC
jgi:hypothetical protein